MQSENIRCRQVGDELLSELCLNQLGTSVEATCTDLADDRSDWHDGMI